MAKINYIFAQLSYPQEGNPRESEWHPKAVKSRLGRCNKNKSGV